MKVFGHFHHKPLDKEALAEQNKGQAKVLIILNEPANEGGVNVSDLSKRMGVTSPFATQIVKVLEEKGLVTRELDQKDRRKVLVQITEKGRQAATEIFDKIHNGFEGLVAFLGTEESEQLVKLLNKTFDYYNSREARGD